MKILIIEDEKELAESIVAYLTGESYICELASTYDEALSKIFGFDYDCILLDIQLPGGDGLHILEELKTTNSNEGVIVISAKGELDDKIKGLKLGADDYLAKPFHLSELGARIYSVIRRKHFNNSNVVVINELEIDLWKKAVTAHSQPVFLTKKEYDLLLFLVGNIGRIISKGAIAEHLSGDMADMLDNHGFVYAHVKNLKKKLSDIGCKDYIKTVYRMGYKWES